MTSKRFTDEFKAEAVKQVSERGYLWQRWPSDTMWHYKVLGRGPEHMAEPCPACWEMVFCRRIQCLYVQSIE